MTVRRGFSMLELVLAIGLSIALAALIGAAINLHLLRLDDSQTTVERAQLARAILERIAADLRAATTAPTQEVGDLLQVASATAPSDSEDPISPPPAPPASSTQAAPAGVSGSADLLVIDRRVVRQSLATQPEGLVPVARLSAGWARVEYGLSADDASPGLVRRESWRDAAIWRDEQGVEPPPTTPLAPEVRSIRFAYFDGDQFVPEWDMAERRSLPAAVRVVVELASAEADDQTVSLQRRQSKAYRRVVWLPESAEAPTDASDSPLEPQDVPSPEEAP